MSRGPPPVKAREAALPVAGKRGLVQCYQHRRGNICDISIMSPGLVSFVRVMRLVRLSNTPEDILHEFSPAIGCLRFIASSPAVSRELWLHTPRGAWRFFRILDDSIIELGPDGTPLKNIATVKHTSAAAFMPATKPMRTLPAVKRHKRTGNPMIRKKLDRKKIPRRVCIRLSIRKQKQIVFLPPYRKKSGTGSGPDNESGTGKNLVPVPIRKNLQGRKSIP